MNDKSKKVKDNFLVYGEPPWKAVIIFGGILSIISLVIFGALIIPGLILICVGFFMRHKS